MTEIDIRPATVDDLPAIVDMLADDVLGATRETPDDLRPYQLAYERLCDDPNQLLVVAVRGGGAGRTVGTLQLTVIPGLSRRGSTRSVIESVRVHSAERGSGIGELLIRWAIAESDRLGCQLVQLTSDRERPEAHRFYERLGFVASHVGFKLQL